MIRAFPPKAPGRAGCSLCAAHAAIPNANLPLIVNIGHFMDYRTMESVKYIHLDMNDMNLNFNLFNSIILAGLVQGLIFGLVVFASDKYRVRSTRYLAGLIVAFSVNNLTYYVLDIDLITRDQFLFYLYFPNALLSPPLMTCYVVSYLKPDNKLTWKQYALFVPFIVFLLAAFAVRLAEAGAMLSVPFGEAMTVLQVLGEYLGIAVTIAVLINLYRTIRRHEKDNHSNAVSDGLNWLKWILATLLLLCMVWIYEMATMAVSGISRAFYMLWIGMSVMIYWLGHMGIYKYGIYEERKQIRSYSIKNEAFQIREKPRNEHIAAMQKLVVDQKMYLDANLTLDKIADELKISKSHLSRIINSELGTGFPDYINSLRVQEAKRYLTNPDFANYTLVAIGLEAGFNSKTTFNSAFKKITGITPSEFKNAIPN